MNCRPNKLTPGFTLLEILMVVAIMGILVTIIITSFSTLNKAQALDKSARQGASILNQARMLTLSSKEDSVYGVHFESSEITLFKGGSYSSNDPDNIISPLNSIVSITNINLSGGGVDVIFGRLTGNTNTPGTVTFSLDSSTATKTISVSGTGLIEIED